MNQLLTAWSFLMSKTLKAIYRSGTFILQTACNLPEGIEVEIFVQSSQVVAPRIADILIF